MSARSKRWLFVTAVIIFALSAAAVAQAADLPPKLAVSDLERVDFYRSDTIYRPLFPEVKEDREKIERLLALYNRAQASLGPEISFYEEFGDAMPMFLNRVSFSLTGGRSVTMVLYQGVSLYTENLTQSRRVTDPEVSKQLEEVALSYFVPAKGVEVSARELHMGQQVTVSSDAARSKEAHILLLPSYWPVTIPSAPFPYPVPEAILLATVPVEHDRFRYTFTLAEEMGRKLDGSPGRIGPGAWQLVVESGGETMLPVTILPAEAPEPRAVVYRQGQVFTWTTGEGLRKGSLSDPADQPLLTGETKWGSPVTHVSLDFLRDWLGVPVAEVEPGRYRLGGPELNLTIAASDDKALVNGTMLSLGGTLRETGGVVRLPWTDLGRFFGYRVQWLGPETVVFLRGLDKVPPDLRPALAPGRVTATRRGRAVTVTLDGKKVVPGKQQAYLDPGCGRVMVPLRATVAALGGRVDWFPVLPGYRESDAGANDGLAPYGEDVNAWVDVTAGRNAWRVYLTPAEGGPAMVPLRELAMALGFDLSWDGPGAAAHLRPEK
ncbi:MAG: hypothetical protein D9V47_01915 [Clostridia bacterium]|nr:MAG: hypothetical protein D9V47_01915 [Clostridia bacterium]